MNIMISTMLHSQQRYPTVGDWDFRTPTNAEPELHVRVSYMGNEDFEFLVGLHELVEAYLCHKRGITDEQVTDFDIKYEATRPPGDTSEPGNYPEAPYHHEHVFATALERAVAREMGVDWDEYEQAVQDLG